MELINTTAAIAAAKRDQRGRNLNPAHFTGCLILSDEIAQYAQFYWSDNYQALCRRRERLNEFDIIDFVERQGVSDGLWLLDVLEIDLPVFRENVIEQTRSFVSVSNREAMETALRFPKEENIHNLLRATVRGFDPATVIDPAGLAVGLALRGENELRSAARYAAEAKGRDAFAKSPSASTFRSAQLTEEARLKDVLVCILKDM